MNYFRKLLTGGVVAICTISLLTSCSKSEDAASSDLAISGGFSGLSSSSMNKAQKIVAMAVTDYTMVCSLLVDPFTSDSAALGADGSFTLSISGGKGLPIGCFLTKSGAIAGVFEFETSASESGSGLTVNSGATKIDFPADMALGTNGVVKVTVANITQDSTVAPDVTWANPTGTWTISKACMKSLDESTGLPKSECMPPSQTGGEIPDSVFLNLVTATKSGAADMQGLAIWKSTAARAACGDVEGSVTLPSGYSASGGWNAAFSGGSNLDLTTVVKVQEASDDAFVQVWDNGGSSETTCSVTEDSSAGALVEGTTKCSDINWTGKGANWGMSDVACELYCVMGAVQRGDSDSINFFDWDAYKGSAVACLKRYRMNWEYGNEYSDDANHDAPGTTAGVLNDGKCDGGGDGCYDSGKEILVTDERGPEDRFMFDLFSVSGNIGTMISKEETGKHDYYSEDGSSSMSCGGTHIEKFTMVQTSASEAQITVEHNFIADVDNDAACASNDEFSEHGKREDGFVLQVTKQ